MRFVVKKLPFKNKLSDKNTGSNLRKKKKNFFGAF